MLEKCRVRVSSRVPTWKVTSCACGFRSRQSFFRVADPECFISNDEEVEEELSHCLCAKPSNFTEAQSAHQLSLADSGVGKLNGYCEPSRDMEPEQHDPYLGSPVPVITPTITTSSPMGNQCAADGWKSREEVGEPEPPLKRRLKLLAVHSDEGDDEEILSAFGEGIAAVNPSQRCEKPSKRQRILYGLLT
jgi:hypothetical protein